MDSKENRADRRAGWRFKYVEKAYLDAKQKVEQLDADLEAKMEEGRSKVGELEKLEAKLEKLSSNEAKLKARVEINKLKSEIEKSKKDAEKIKEALNEAKIDIDHAKDEFKTLVPEGSKILEEMKLAGRKERYDITTATYDNKLNDLVKEVKDTNSVENYLRIDPNFKKAFDGMSKYPWICMDLIEKEVDKTLTQDEADELKKFRDEFRANKNEVKKFLRSKKLDKFNLEDYEANLFDHQGISVKDNFAKLLEKNKEKESDIKLAREEEFEFYTQKSLKYKDLENDPTSTGEDGTNKPLVQEEGRFQKFLNWAKSFVNKFRFDVPEAQEDDKGNEDDKDGKGSNDNKDEKEGKGSETELSEKFIKEMSASEFFKAELEKQADSDDVEIAKNIAARKKAREQAQQQAKTKEDDSHER